MTAPCLPALAALTATAPEYEFWEIDFKGRSVRSVPYMRRCPSFEERERQFRRILGLIETTGRYTDKSLFEMAFAKSDFNLYFDQACGCTGMLMLRELADYPGLMVATGFMQRGCEDPTELGKGHETHFALPFREASEMPPIEVLLRSRRMRKQEPAAADM